MDLIDRRKTKTEEQEEEEEEEKAMKKEGELKVLSLKPRARYTRTVGEGLRPSSPYCISIQI